MPTIAAGTSPNLTLPAGQQFAFSAGGSGLVTILRAGGASPLKNLQVGASPVTIGPYQIDHVLSVYAENALTYTVVAPTSPTKTPPLQGVTQDPMSAQQYAGGAVVSGYGVGRGGRRLRTVVAGDSNTARNSNKTSATPTVAGAIGGYLVTLTLTGHGRFPGDLIQIGNFVDVAYNGVFVVESRIDANTLTYHSAIALSTTTGGGGTGEARLPTQWGSNSYFPYLNGLLGDRLEMVRNAGNVGEKVAQLAARYDRDVLAYSPDLTINMIGTNNIRAAETAASIWLDLEPLMDKSAAGCPMNVWCTYFNPAAASGNFSPAKTTELQALNQLIRNKCATNPRLIPADVFNTMVDRGTATLPTRAENIEDADIHVSGLGARMVAQAIADPLRTRTAPVDMLPTSPDQAFGITAGYILDNPLMFPGTPITGVGPVTGVQAAGWRIDAVGGGSEAVVASVIPRTMERDGDQCGFNQRLAITFAAANDAVQFRQTNLHTRLVAGGIYQAAMVLRTESLPADLKDLRLTFNFTADSVVYSSGMQAQSNNDGSTSKLSNLNDVLTMVTTQVRVPVGAAAITTGEIFLYCRGAGAAVFALEAARALVTRVG